MKHLEDKKYSFAITKETPKVRTKAAVVRQGTAKPRLNTAIKGGASRGMLIGKYVKFNNTKAML